MTNMSVINNTGSDRTKGRLSGIERQRQILKETQELCTEKGFAGTTLDKIARKAGVSRALLVQHFGSKEGIYEALIDFLFQNHPLEGDLDLREYLEREDDYGVFRAFSLHVFRHMTRDKTHSPLRLILYSMLEKPDIYEKHCRRRQAKALNILEGYLSRRIKEGVFKRINPHHVAVGFLAMLTQISIQEVTIPQFHREEAFLNLVDTVIDILIEGLKKRE